METFAICLHETTETDDNDDAICVKCGEVVRVIVINRNLDEARETYERKWVHPAQRAFRAMTRAVRD